MDDFDFLLENIGNLPDDGGADGADDADNYAYYEDEQQWVSGFKDRARLGISGDDEMRTVATDPLAIRLQRYTRSGTDIFRQQVEKSLSILAKKLKLDTHAKRTIIEGIPRVNMPQFKPAAFYILGYFVFLKDFTDDAIQLAVSLLPSEFATSGEFEIVKFGKYWSNILS